MPEEEGAVGVYSNATDPPEELNYARYSDKVQSLLERRQHPTECKEKPFLIWESWGDWRKCVCVFDTVLWQELLDLGRRSWD